MWGATSCGRRQLLPSVEERASGGVPFQSGNNVATLSILKPIPSLWKTPFFAPRCRKSLLSRSASKENLRPANMPEKPSEVKYGILL
jgi:hypothetical protein